MKTEAQIRDYIAVNLNLIESDLTLIETEYKLDNGVSRGFVDILAKDRFGNLVIIELKKSKNTARQALHELHKYVGLVKQIFQIQDGKIRCILLSLEWDELITPFSNFVYRTPSYQVEGYQIIINSAGISQQCEKISLIPRPKLTTTAAPCRHHVIYLYKTESRKIESEIELKKIISEIDSTFLVFTFLYQGNNPHVLYTHAHYVVPFIIPSENIRSIADRLQISLEDYEKVDLEGDDRMLEQEILGYIGTRYREFTDTAEVGYPEKLGVLFDQGWVLKDVLRFGKAISSKEIFSDEDLVRNVKGFEGQHTSIYHAEVTMSNKVRWQEMREEISYTLLGNDLWQTVANAYLDEIEKDHHTSDITVNIYNPSNTMITMLKLRQEDGYKYVPLLEIAVKEEKLPKILLVSTLKWNGMVITETSENIINNIFGSMNDFLFHLHFGETYLEEGKTLSSHGLFYDFAEVHLDGKNIVDAYRIVPRDNKLERTQDIEETALSLYDFAIKHDGYLSELERLLSTSSHGL